MGTPARPIDQAAITDALAAARAMLGGISLADPLVAGRALPLEQILGSIPDGCARCCGASARRALAQK